MSDLSHSLFKAYYLARWSRYVPFVPGLEQDWYEQMEEAAPNGAVLIDIFPLKEAQVAELQRLWSL
jgi:hypothetical protein